VIVPAEMVLAVVPSVVSTPEPEMLNELPILSALVTAPPTCREIDDMILWVRSARAGEAAASVTPNTKSVRII
jgi:hypothetical protein